MKVLPSSRLIIAVPVVVLLTVTGYLSAYGRLSTIEPGLVAVIPEFTPAQALVRDDSGKTLASLSSREYVMIGDKRFEVLPPWLGHRIEMATASHNLDFAMLPVDLVLERREIYVTASTRDAFVVMAAAALLDGVDLVVDSGYRSEAYQRRIFQRKMAEGDEFDVIVRGVAPPGYSEHMLGTTLDLVPSKWTFNGTSAEKWLMENAADYAFIQSYPQKSDRGFTWEPWHWKYVGDS